MNIKDYIGKELLGWIYYNENYSNAEYLNSINRVCYVFPRYIISENEITQIDPKDFPQLGSFEVRIQGGFSAEEIVEKLTHLVSIRINIAPEVDKKQQNNCYRLKFNPSYGDESSEVWLERFRNDDFYQVISTDDDIGTILNERKLDYVLEKIYTKYILIKSKDSIFGPFNYFIDESTVDLRSIEDYDFNIMIDNKMNLDKFIFKVGDKSVNGVNLIRKTDFNTIDKEDNKIDFISDQMLIENILNVFEREEIVNSVDIKQLKKTLMNTLVDKNILQVNSDRIDRVRNIIKASESGSDFLFKISTFLMNDANLQDYVIGLIIDNRFDEIEERLPVFIEVREKISELNREKDKLKAELQGMSIEVDKARDFLIREHEELAYDLNKKIRELEDCLQVKYKELEELGYVNDLALERKCLDADIEKNKLEINRLNNTKQEIIDELRDSIEEYKNVGRVIAKELRQEGMDDFLSTIKGLKSFDSFEEERLEEAEFSSKDELLEYIYYMMNFKYNHNISRTMVANLVVLFGMSFITNFRGASGSGKTSTVVNFARTLGLSEDNGLFVKVNIDPDIRSPRDLIGFYNPISGEVTSNNLRLLNLMERAETLDLPHIVLLDNANLSMPEHYLSSFLEHDMGNTDYLNLGGGKEILISDNIRLYTTLQNDHTSLELSSRYFDKTATIESKIDGRNFYQREMDNIREKGVIKMSDLMSFQIRDDINPEFESKLTNIENIFKRYDSPLSLRTAQKSRNFIASISPLISSKILDSKYLPLELAVIQFMIPGRVSLNLNKRLIDSLLQETRNMPLLEKTLIDFRDKFDKFILDTSIGF